MVVLYNDDIGYGDLGCFDAVKVKTPNIDRLAQRGKMFLDARTASSVSPPSRYCLQTGQNGFREDVFGPIFNSVGALIDPERFTLAEVMKQAG